LSRPERSRLRGAGGPNGLAVFTGGAVACGERGGPFAQAFRAQTVLEPSFGHGQTVGLGRAPAFGRKTAFERAPATRAGETARRLRRGGGCHGSEPYAGQVSYSSGESHLWQGHVRPPHRSHRHHRRRAHHAVLAAASAQSDPREGNARALAAESLSRRIFSENRLPSPIGSEIGFFGRMRVRAYLAAARAAVFQFNTSWPIQPAISASTMTLPKCQTSTMMLAYPT
jgi:hypothetical protein